MHTEIELSDELEARLKKLAKRRGETNYARLLEEAVVAGLRAMESEARRDPEAIERALAVLGSFTDEEAEALRKRIHENRKLG